MYSKITIVIPTYKEAENIGELIDKVTTMYPSISIIVADDSSRDGTQEIVKDFSKINKNVRLLDRTGKVKGLTASVLDGVMQAKTPYVIVMDADFQHPPETVKSIAEQLFKGGQVVVGTRTDKPNDWGFSRHLASGTAILLGRIRLSLAGAYARDVVSGFFGARTDLFKEQIKKYSYRFVPEGYKVLLDLLKTLPRKTKVTEATYAFELRKEGKSKMRTKHILAYFKSLLS